MKIKRSIQTVFLLQPDAVEEKINTYLKKNFYRITDRGTGYIIFIDDEYSDRLRPRSDYHNRIGEGKFEFYSSDNGTTVKLIYLTPILFPVLAMTLFGAIGVYAKNFIPIILSFVLTIPIILKIHIMNQDVFDEVLKC